MRSTLAAHKAGVRRESRAENSVGFGVKCHLSKWDSFCCHTPRRQKNPETHRRVALQSEFPCEKSTKTAFKRNQTEREREREREREKEREREERRESSEWSGDAKKRNVGIHLQMDQVCIRIIEENGDLILCFSLFFGVKRKEE